MIVIINLLLACCLFNNPQNQSPRCPIRPIAYFENLPYNAKFLSEVDYIVDFGGFWVVGFSNLFPF